MRNKGSNEKKSYNQKDNSSLKRGKRNKSYKQKDNLSLKRGKRNKSFKRAIYL